jgi:hypothetical protein
MGGERKNYSATLRVARRYRWFEFYATAKADGDNNEAERPVDKPLRSVRRLSCFLFLDGHGAFADPFTQVSKLGAANRTFPLDFDLVHPR